MNSALNSIFLAPAIKKQRRCPDEACKAQLKAEHQKKLLDAGYWRDEKVQLIRQKRDYKKRLLKRNPDLYDIMKPFLSTFLRILDEQVNEFHKYSQIIECKMLELFNDLLSRAP